VISSGRPVAEVARNLGIVEGTLGSWVAKAKENGEANEPELDVSERAELARLRKENQQLKMERDFLKKAAAFFASQNP
jgi:transposase